MVAHHPSSDLLISYGAGALGECWSLALATHLSLCPSCRSGVEAIEEIGGILLQSSEPNQMPESALRSVMAKLDIIPNDDQKVSLSPTISVLPQPLRDYVGSDFDAMRWKAIGGGVGHINVEAGDQGHAHLLKIPPGRPVPEHGHNGRELTLVLTGSFEDGSVTFNRGDLQDVGEETVHRPVAGRNEGCICLVVTDAPLNFKGMLPKIAQPFIRRVLNAPL